MKLIDIYIAIVVLVMGLITGCGGAYAKSFHVTEDGPVIGMLIGASAEYGSLLSIEVNGDHQYSPYQAIFNHGVSGQVVNFGTFTAGDELVFRLDVINTGDTWYSGTTRNVDGQAHMGFYGDGIINIGFEDLYGGGDRDFNDMVATFYNISAVPEPETYAMLLIGLVLIGFTKFHSR